MTLACNGVFLDCSIDTFTQVMALSTSATTENIRCVSAVLVPCLNFFNGSKVSQHRREGSRNGSVNTSQSEAERQLFVWLAMKSSSVSCLWCSQAGGQVSDRRSLCTALPSARELQRGCSAMLHGKNSREAKPAAPHIQHRVERSMS